MNINVPRRNMKTKKYLNNVKKLESEILQNYDDLVMRGFYFSKDFDPKNPYHTNDKISRLCKKTITQQMIDSTVPSDSDKQITKEKNKKLSSKKKQQRKINPDIDIDQILDEISSADANEDQFDAPNDVQPIIQTPIQQIQQKDTNPIINIKENTQNLPPQNKPIQNTPPQNVIPQNMNNSLSGVNEMDLLAQIQFKALQDLRQQTDAISNEIARRVQYNQFDPSIEELRKERRNMWERIENLEKGLQAAKEVSISRGNFLNTFNTNNENDTNDNTSNQINQIIKCMIDDNRNNIQNNNFIYNNTNEKYKNDYKPIPNQDKNNNNNKNSTISLTDKRIFSDDEDDDDHDIEDEYSLDDNDETQIFDENSSDYFNIYPEERAQIDKDLLAQITKINREVFHHAKFRGCQAAAIEAILSGKDVFLLMPTGGGKSLVYQLAGYLQKKLTIIISPLISLIKDQVRSLNDLNLSATALIGETSNRDTQTIIEQIQKNEILYLFITPEKLLSSAKVLDFFYTIHKRGMIARFVIDEAHCVSQWGHDFRPAYTNLDIIKERYENIPILVMTATATSAVKKDIINILKIPNCQVFQMSFNRSNLIYEVREKGDIYQSYRTILSFIKEHHFEDKCGLIFCMTVSETEAISSFLNIQGLKAHHYHAQMKDKDDRHKVQQQWMDGKINIIVATLAFGMGIDKPDVRFVIHHTMPKSIEAYYQESGRAGRDGLRSYCVLLFNFADKQRVERLIMSEFGVFDNNNNNNENGENEDSSKDHLISSAVVPKKKPDNRLNNSLQLLDAITNYCIDRTTCRRVMLLNYFSENFSPEDCNPKCDNCLRMENGKISIIKVDLTKHAELMAEIINEITLRRPDQQPFPTPRYVISLYVGINSQRARASQDSVLTQFGLGADMSLKDYLLYQAFPILIEKRIIKARIKTVLHGTIQYFATGPAFEEYKENGFPYIEVEDEIESKYEGMTKEDSELFPILLEKRRMLSQDRNIDPNSICSVKILRCMAKARPKNMDDLLNIPNMTKKKAKDYGMYFTEVVSRFENEIAKRKARKAQAEKSDDDFTNIDNSSSDVIDEEHCDFNEGSDDFNSNDNSFTDNNDSDNNNNNNSNSFSDAYNRLFNQTNDNNNNNRNFNNNNFSSNFNSNINDDNLNSNRNFNNNFTSNFNSNINDNNLNKNFNTNFTDINSNYNFNAGTNFINTSSSFNSNNFYSNPNNFNNNFSNIYNNSISANNSSSSINNFNNNFNSNSTIFSTQANKNRSTNDSSSSTSSQKTRTPPKQSKFSLLSMKDDDSDSDIVEVSSFTSPEKVKLPTNEFQVSHPYQLMQNKEVYNKFKTFMEQKNEKQNNSKPTKTSPSKKSRTTTTNKPQKQQQQQTNQNQSQSQFQNQRKTNFNRQQQTNQSQNQNQSQSQRPTNQNQNNQFNKNRNYQNQQKEHHFSLPPPQGRVLQNKNHQPPQTREYQQNRNGEHRNYHEHQNHQTYQHQQRQKQQPNSNNNKNDSKNDFVNRLKKSYS